MNESDYLEAIRRNPDEDPPRLEYAQWLSQQESTSQAARAEFIRVQITLSDSNTPEHQRETLRSRAQYMLQEYGLGWNRRFAPLERAQIHYDRGMVHSISILGDFAEEDLECLRLAPALQSVSVLSDSLTDRGIELLAELHSLIDVDIESHRVTGAGLRPLAGLPRLCSVVCRGNVQAAEAARRIRLQLGEQFRQLPQDQQRQVAIRYLRAHPFPEVSDVNRVTTAALSQCWVADEDLAYLPALPELERVSLYQNPVTSAGLEHLRSLQDLRCLELSDTDVADLSPLTALPHLEVLDLSWNSALTDDGAASLSQMTSLRELHLSGTSITDRSLAYLERLSQLESLFLYHLPGITPVGLLKLAQLPKLQQLRLDVDDDSALESLRDLTHLQQLDLGGGFTDFGLVSLESLKGLKHLGLEGSAISLTGAERLAGSLPQATVRVRGQVIRSGET